MKINTITNYNSQPLKPSFASREDVENINNRTINMASKYALIDPKNQGKNIFSVLGSSFIKALGINPNSQDVDTNNDVLKSIDTARYWVV